MSQQHENHCKCNCKTPCQNCKCKKSNPSTSSEKTKRYFGESPDDLDAFVSDVIDRQHQYPHPHSTTVAKAGEFKY
mgnify:CR=1 FL=1